MGQASIRIEWAERSVPQLFALLHTGVRHGKIVDFSRGTDYLTGTSGADSISGYGGTDYLFGGAGNDTIDGGDGSDSIHGEDGHDSIRGGAGNDYILASSGNDSVQGGDDMAPFTAAMVTTFWTAGKERISFMLAMAMM